MSSEKLQDMTTDTLRYLTEAYQKELERRAKLSMQEKEEYLTGFKIGMSLFNKEGKKECDNCKELEKRIQFWKAGYFRLSAEIKDMLESTTTPSYNLKLNLHKAKETVDILAEKLVDYENRLKELNKRDCRCCCCSSSDNLYE